MLFIRYVKRLLIITAVLCVAAIGYHLLAPGHFQNPLMFHLLGFFFLIMVISHYISIRVIGGDLQKFIRIYMLSAMSRLLLYMAFILIYIFRNPHNTMNFVFTFFVFYVVFTTFEVREISSSIGKKSK
jgi:hypothetical protein